MAVYHSVRNESLLNSVVTSFIISLSGPCVMPWHISQTDNLHCLNFSSKRQFEKKVLKKPKCENATTELDQIFKNKFYIL